MREDEFIVKIPDVMQQITGNKKLLESVGNNSQCIITSNGHNDYSTGSTGKC